MCGICGCETSHAFDHQHTPAEPTIELVSLEKSLLAKNDNFAADNRRHLEQQNILAINLISSPGSGKTSLLTRTVQLLLKNQLTIGVIEGDQETDLDAQRIRALGIPTLQINTGKGCHLDAHQVGHAIHELNLPNNSLLFIENVGNLVCPALFDLGEAAKVVVLSVTEGEDKPLKYPEIFAAADLMIINKIDLLPYVDFSLEKCVNYANAINPNITVINLSATKGMGVDQWNEWLLQKMRLLESTNFLR